MDKNTIYGFILIALIIIGFSWLSRPNEKEQARQKQISDSIALVQQQAETQTTVSSKNPAKTDSTPSKDSTNLKVSVDSLGSFSAAANGVEKYYTLENELIKVIISNKGGRICSVNLKKYRTYDSLPLTLFDEKESSMNFTLVTNNNRVVNSSNLFFDQIGSVMTDKSGNQTLTLRLKTTQNGYVDFVYTLPKNNYMMSFGIKASNMNSVMPVGTNSLDMHWAAKIPQQEKGRKFEDRYSGIEFKYEANDVDRMNTAKADEKKVDNRVKWIAFKDQFFSSILIAGNSFTSTSLSSVPEDDNSKYIKSCEADMSVAFDPTGKSPTVFNMYFGPNQYKILSSYDRGIDNDKKLHLSQLIPLGWGIFGWVNRFAIIPMFNLFSTFIGSFGLIILLMTIVIKLVLFPLTYKSYISSAKMRVLKPEIDEINARIPAEKAAERQKAQMDLYNKVGVSPMSGCLPTLLQMPILFAMFSFFPASIELRQQSFLWVKDLSSYDSILSWNTYIPFITNYFGNHISLFCLLMTIASIISTKLNMSTTPTDQPGGSMMKWMMYLMPVMFMVWFNNYAAGLSYYYFISTLITIIQTYAIRATVDEKKLLAELHAKRNSKSTAKKSSWLERIEKMQHEQQKSLKNRK